MQSTFEIDNLLKLIRRWLLLVVVVLVISGITVFPLEWELGALVSLLTPGSELAVWLERVRDGISATNTRFPFLSYGYDWLAFAHLVLAILFAGALRNPVRNKWVVEFGMIACVLIVPFAMLAGHFRGIPFWWGLTDCSFGVFGLVALSQALGAIHKIENRESQKAMI